jgi:hypothetical protein
VGKQHWATLDRGGKYIPLEPAFTIKEVKIHATEPQPPALHACAHHGVLPSPQVKIHPTEPEWMMASHLTEGCKGAERKECNMEVYLTQGALLHHTCNARRRCCSLGPSPLQPYSARHVAIPQLSLRRVAIPQLSPRHVAIPQLSPRHVAARGPATAHAHRVLGTAPAHRPGLCLLGGGLLLGRPLATAPFRTGAHHGARRVEQTSARPGG